jgi:phosphoserine aminotransferase
VFNFSAGPAVLPEDVLREAADEMLDYKGCGMSVMEMSHRSGEFAQIIQTAEQDLRDLMGIPGNYRVLFMQGGGTAQFSAIPLNLLNGGVGDYIVSGSWSKKAAKEAARMGRARVIASSEDDGFNRIPDLENLHIDEDASYVYLCHNETITGTVYHELPETGDVPLVADISSSFLSEPIDVSRFGLLFGGVQKNIGPAGVAIVIVRDDLIPEKTPDGVPIILDYRTTADKGSLYNTPPCYTIYICGKVFKWLKAQGGIEAIGRRNHAKADALYGYLDKSDLFKTTVRKQDRSIMNVPFVTGDADLDAAFIEACRQAGIVNIKGHRSVGGMRASIYNAMPIEGVNALLDVMESFERSHG